MAVGSSGSVLLTDLYELTMMQSYFDCGMNDTASFEFFVRKFPARRSFLMAAGLAQVLAYLHELSFCAEEIEALARVGRFSDAFLASLQDLRFTGDVDAMPEGSVFFAEEPILRITAPLREAQLVESRVMNLLHYQTLVASKAARIVLAAPGKVLVDFGLRRAHGAEAALLSARASWLAGFSGTATVLAGVRFGIPVYGTMAHSYIQAHRDEMLAFEHFARTQPGNATLLIDTYDTEAAAHKVVALAARLRGEGLAIQGVRLDSGDLGEHARRVRTILDGGGLRDLTIFASGNLDEDRVSELVRSGAPIDGFGVGTRMNTSSDAPYLDCAYKLVEYAGEPRRKRSEGKATWPGRKQVYRRRDELGKINGDCLTLADEPHDGEPLLHRVLSAGAQAGALPELADSRAYAQRQLAELPPVLRDVRPAGTCPVEIGASLQRLARELDSVAH